LRGLGALRGLGQEGEDGGATVTLQFPFGATAPTPSTSWWQDLLKTGVVTTENILTKRYATPPPGTYIASGPSGSVYVAGGSGSGVPAGATAFGTPGFASISGSTLLFGGLALVAVLLVASKR
jgi:hypothetical protein